MDQRTFPRECPVCGHRWEAIGNRAKYCSVACRVYAAKHPGQRAPRSTQCATCGAPTANRRFTYCSLACRPTGRPAGRDNTEPLASRKRDAVCDFCGRGFSTAKTLQKYCSTWCSDTAQNQPGTYADRIGRTCPYCGTGLPVTARHDSRFCSTGCQVKHNQGIRRARQRGLPAESVDRYAVFERDDWMCSLCGEPIDKALTGRHPMSASLDHVIPLAWPDSPGHVLSNVAAAHLRCNISKGAGSIVGR